MGTQRTRSVELIGFGDPPMRIRFGRTVSFGGLDGGLGMMLRFRSSGSIMVRLVQYEDVGTSSRGGSEPDCSTIL